jgi:hypothetical protein
MCRSHFADSLLKCGIVTGSLRQHMGTIHSSVLEESIGWWSSRRNTRLLSTIPSYFEICIYSIPPMRRKSHGFFVFELILLFFLLFLKDFFNQLECTEISAHGTGISGPIPFVNLSGMIPKKGIRELSFPIQVFPRKN